MFSIEEPKRYIMPRKYMYILVLGLMLPYNFMYSAQSSIGCYIVYTVIVALLCFWVWLFAKKYLCNKTSNKLETIHMCNGWVIEDDRICFDISKFKDSTCDIKKEITIIKRVGILHPVYFILFYLVSMNIVCFCC